jgi:uncharacterized membrane protein YoaK (UPF0700 family)
MEHPQVGITLAFMAGLANAWTLAHAETFATVQSGNVIQSGYRLVQGDYAAFWFALISVVAFGIGSAACGVLMSTQLRKGKTYTVPALWFEAALLVAFGLLMRLGLVEDARFIAIGVSFVFGWQGNAFHKNHGMLYGNVAVTFVVQMAFNFWVQSFFKKQGINGDPNSMWAWIFFSILFAFAIGGGLGFLLDLKVLDHASLYLAGLVAVFLALRASSMKSDPDPTPGGLIG